MCGTGSFYFLLVSTWRGSNELWESVYAKPNAEAGDFDVWPREGRHATTTQGQGRVRFRASRRTPSRRATHSPRRYPSCAAQRTQRRTSPRIRTHSALVGSDRWPVEAEPGFGLSDIAVVGRRGVRVGEPARHQARYSITEAGQTELQAKISAANGPPTWMTAESVGSYDDLRKAVAQLMIAAKQIGMSDDQASIDTTVGILNDARRKLYQLLADAGNSLQLICRMRWLLVSAM